MSIHYFLFAQVTQPAIVVRAGQDGKPVKVKPHVPVGGGSSHKGGELQKWTKEMMEAAVYDFNQQLIKHGNCAPAHFNMSIYYYVLYFKYAHLNVLNLLQNLTSRRSTSPTWRGNGAFLGRH